MARPKKNNADYFSHESEMRNDVKVKALRRKFSHTGYAVWNYLLEVLTDAEGFSIKWEELDIELYAADFDLETTELIEIVDYCIRLGLLQKENNYLFCSNLTASFSSLLSKRVSNTRVSASETTQKGSFCSGNPNNNGVSASEMHIVEKSKVEYSKVNNNSPSRAHEGAYALSKEERDGLYEIFFFRNLKNPDMELERFIQHNGQYGWKANNTPAKRTQAAYDWIPEEKGGRISANFLAAWAELYKRLKFAKPDVAKDMLDLGSRLSVNNGAVVIHARKSVQDYIQQNNPSEIINLAKGYPLRFSWP